MSQRKGHTAPTVASAKPAAVRAAPTAAAATTPSTPSSSLSSSPWPVTPSLLLPLLVFSVVLALYLLTAYPSISGGDSGELVVTTCQWGIAHPPGYPLYTMMGAMWSRTISAIAGYHVHVAYALNCMSAVLGAVAAALLACTTSMLSSRTPFHASSSSSLGSSLAGLYTGVGFAGMPTVWLYSIQGEVFALNNFLVALLLMLTVRYYTREEQVDQAQALVARSKKGGGSGEGHAKDDGKDDAAAASPSPLPSSRTLFPAALFGAFVCGLCLTNQHTTVFPVLVTASAISLSLYSHGQLGVAHIAQLVLSVLLGLSPYAYVLIRSHARVADSWGDQRTLAGFLTHLLREEYGTFQLAASELSTDPGMVSRLGVYGQNLLREMVWGAPLFALLGLYFLVRSPSRAVRRSALVLSFSWLVYTAVFHKLANLDLRPLFLGVQARFWQQSNAYVYVAAGVGVKGAAEWGGQMLGKMMMMKRERERAPQSAPLRPPTSFSLLLTGALVLPSLLLHVLHHYPALDHSGTSSFYAAGVAQLNSFPPGSLVLLNGDLNHNMLKYPHACEGVRSHDLSLLSLQLMSWEWWVPMQRGNYPNVTFPGNRYHVTTEGSFHIKKFLDANVAPLPTAAKKKGKGKGNTDAAVRQHKKLPGGVFLCGPFKDGDHSNVRSGGGVAGGAGGELTRHYEEHPFGQCNQLLPHGQAPANLSAFLRQGWGGIPRARDMPPFVPERMGDDTWEHVLYRDLYTRLSYLTSFASFHTNRDPSDPSLLRLAHDLTGEMLDDSQVLRSDRTIIGPHEYRSAGVIYGMWAKHLDAHSDAAEAAAESRRNLYRAWLRFSLLQPGDPEIWPFVRDRIDPYSGVHITGLEEQPDWPQVQAWLDEATRQATAKATPPAAQAQPAATTSTHKKTKKKQKQERKK